MKIKAEKINNNNNKNKTKQKNKSNTSWRNDADNYASFCGGLFVEDREVVETAVDITVGSDDDASVKDRARYDYSHKKLFPVVWVLYFLLPDCSSLAQIMLAFQNWYQ